MVKENGMVALEMVTSKCFILKDFKSANKSLLLVIIFCQKCISIQ
jgi:hypothetical protein